MGATLWPRRATPSSLTINPKGLTKNYFMERIESVESRSIQKGLSGADKRAYNSLSRNYVSEVFLQNWFHCGANHNCEHLHKVWQLLRSSPWVLGIHAGRTGLLRVAQSSAGLVLSALSSLTNLCTPVGFIEIILQKCKLIMNVYSWHAFTLKRKVI